MRYPKISRIRLTAIPLVVVTRNPTADNTGFQSLAKWDWAHAAARRGKQVLNNVEEWQKLEYEELNRYSRTIYETLFRLAQMTFVLNVGLGGGFSYVYQSTHFRDSFYFGAFITILALIYNLGATYSLIIS